jgi:hypothetical protein
MIKFVRLVAGGRWIRTFGPAEDALTILNGASRGLNTLRHRDPPDTAPVAPGMVAELPPPPLIPSCRTKRAFLA